MLFELMIGIIAIQSVWYPLDENKAKRYAKHAIYHARRYKIDPYELIGLARNESMFKERLVANKNKDCGIAQIRYIYSRYSCKKLQNSWYNFSEAARMLAMFSKSCKGRKDYERCRFNRYNAGWKFSPNNKYWLRVKCYANAAKKKIKVGDRCRKITSLSQIKKMK